MHFFGELTCPYLLLPSIFGWPEQGAHECWPVPGSRPTQRGAQRRTCPCPARGSWLVRQWWDDGVPVRASSWLAHARRAYIAHRNIGPQQCWRSRLQKSKMTKYRALRVNQCCQTLCHAVQWTTPPKIKAIYSKSTHKITDCNSAKSWSWHQCDVFFGCSNSTSSGDSHPM